MFRCTEKCRALIIGAGASGIAAAARFVAAGFTGSEVIILEGSDRIGGRINTKSFGMYL